MSKKERKKRLRRIENLLEEQNRILRDIYRRMEVLLRK